MTSGEAMDTPIANIISVEQNSQRQILRIAAASTVYSRAKQVLAFQVVLTVLGGFAWSIAVARFPEAKVWASFYSFTVALVDALVLERIQSELRKQGAKIQELFDCELLHLPWRRLTAGDPPDPEVIAERGNRYIRKNPDLSRIKDWYPPSVSMVPLPLARLICQRSNAWWDASLRRRYGVGLQVLLWLLGVFVFALAIRAGMSLENFVLAVLAPLTPAILWGVREIRKQTSTTEALGKLKGHIEQQWNAALNSTVKGEGLDRTSVEIQNEIFHLRSGSPFIFNWVNQLLRDRQQKTMNEAADEFVAQALSKISGE